MAVSATSVFLVAVVSVRRVVGEDKLPRGKRRPRQRTLRGEEVRLSGGEAEWRRGGSSGIKMKAEFSGICECGGLAAQPPLLFRCHAIVCKRFKNIN
jgi:hypothetical protein